MVTHKTARQKGKLSFSRFFQKLLPGDAVAVVRELSVPFFYSKRLQGRTGKVIAKRGNSYEVLVKHLNKPKTYMIPPIHLKKIQGAA